MGRKRFGRLCLVLLLAALLAPAQDAITGAERVVVIGDLHGDYDRLVELLRAAGLVDRKLKWAGGRSHLVQTGDVVDRAPDSRKILDLLMALQKQAPRNGGRVHALIGNHEAMNLYGDLRYTHPGEIAAFRRSNSAQVRDAIYEQIQEEMKKSPPPGGAPVFDEAYRKKFDDEHPLGFFEHRFQFGPKGDYGKWIRANNAVLRIDETLFVHGGISPKYAQAAAAAINAKIREELDDFTKLPGGMTTDEQGPLWYRGLVEGDEAALAEHVKAVLAFHGVRRIVVGHTVTPGGIAPRFGGAVYPIDVGLSRAYGGPAACLAIEKGQPRVIQGGAGLDKRVKAP